VTQSAALQAGQSLTEGQKRDFSALSVYDRPLAAPGLQSYRCKGQYGWIMIGANDDEHAMREALRSSAHAKFENLQRWDGSAYVSCQAPAQKELPALPGEPASLNSSDAARNQTDLDELSQPLPFQAGNTLKAIEGYLASKADHGDEVASGLRNMLKPLLNSRQIIRELRDDGYAVVLFSPTELGSASARSLESRLVELGNEAIDDLQEYSTEERPRA
jgi:hypothetical protein